ncbi:hypothetical protein VB779_01365 [Haloarculaceae archaeon H-GB11]|nr:hypothetical protein [Haloarculaceae archaeon H-GB11]
MYDSTVLYDRFPTRNLTRTEQTIVDGKYISVVALNGSYARSEQGAVTVQVERSSSSGTTVPVTNVSAGQNVTLLVPTTLSASQWEDLLDGQFVDQGGHVRRASLQTIPLPDTVGHYLRIELQPNVTYQLQMAKVGLGTGVQSESATYLTDTSGNRTSVPEGGTQQVVVSVRDRYNNHVSDVQVRANTSGSGSLTFAGENESDADGDVTMTYHAPQDIDGSGNTVFVNVSLQGPREDVLGSFDPTTPENVTLQLTVENTDGSGLGGGGGGGGAYALTWQDPSGQTGVECPGGANDVCTLYSNETADASLTAETDPVVPGATVTYLVNNSTVGTVSPSSGVTDSTGTDATTLEPEGNGSVTVFASSGGSGDALEMVVENFTARGIGEVGVETTDQTGFQTISLEQEYDNPVVIARPLSWDDSEPIYVRVQNVQAESFEYKIEEFDNDDEGDGHEQVTFHYLVLEEGVHELSDGTIVEAGTNRVDGSADTVAFNHTFGATPIVFSQPLTTNDPTPVVIRQESITTTSFQQNLEESQANGQTGHGIETAGYVAIEQGTGSNDEAAYEAGTTGNVVRGVDNGWTTITFSQTFTQSPALFAQMQSQDGPNTAWERYRLLDRTDVEVSLDEDQTTTASRAHTTENVGYFGYQEFGVFDGTTLGANSFAIYRQTDDDLAGVGFLGLVETYSTDTPLSLGPGADIDGDGDVDVPYIENDGNPKGLLMVDQNGNTETLVGTGNTSPITSNSRLAVADLPRDADSKAGVIYVTSKNEIYTYEDGENGGDPQLVSDVVSAAAIGGVGDFDEDGNADDIAYVSTSNDVRFLDTSDGTVEGTTLPTTGANTIGEPADFDGDGSDEVPYFEGGNLHFADAANGDVKVLAISASASAMGTEDWDSDGDLDVVYLDGSQVISYVDYDGNTATVSGSPTAATATGVVEGQRRDRASRPTSEGVVG